jgi:hypothetical protein
VESLGVRRIDDVAAQLVGESGERFLFAFDVTENTNKIKFKGQEIPIQIGFVYEKQGDNEMRFYNDSMASITAHAPYWRDPTTEFTPEEIERIVNLHPLGGDGKPLTPEELEWNHQQFPH